MSAQTQEHILASFKNPQGGLGQIIAQHMNEEYAELNEWAVQSLNIQPTDNILEIGYGTGMAIQTLSQLAPEGQIMGIDYSELMFQQASQKNEAAIASGQVKLLLGKIEEFPDLSLKFDKVLAVNNMMYWEDPYTALRNIALNLKIDGTLSIIYQRSPEHLYSQKGLDELKWYTDLLQHAGFGVEFQSQGLKRLYRNLEKVNQKKITHSHRFHILGIKITARKRFILGQQPQIEIHRPAPQLDMIKPAETSNLLRTIQNVINSLTTRFRASI